MGKMDMLTSDETDVHIPRDSAVLVVNIAGLCGYTQEQMKALNELQELYEDHPFTVWAIPANQHGLQENAKNEELLNLYKYVRPGDGFEPNFPITTKQESVGKNAGLLGYLAHELPLKPENKNRRYLTDTSPNGLHTKKVSKTTVEWNFGKALVGPDGSLIKRFHPSASPVGYAITDAINDVLGLDETPGSSKKKNKSKAKKAKATTESDDQESEDEPKPKAKKAKAKKAKAKKGKRKN